MAEPRLYTTAQALRTALEARLQDMAQRHGTDIQRLRRRVAFDGSSRDCSPPSLANVIPGFSKVGTPWNCACTWPGQPKTSI